MKKIIALSILFILSYSLFAQEVTFDDRKKEYKDAIKHLKIADKLMSEQPVPLYSQALEHYIQAYNFNPKSAHVNYNLGICYLNTAQKFKALEYFQNAYALNPKVGSDIDFYLGRGYQLKMEWDQAISHYEKYKQQQGIGESTDTESAKKDVRGVNKRIFECRSGKELMRSSTRVWIQRMDSSINTKYPEYGMILTADASEIFFTSRRPKNENENESNSGEDYFEGIFSSNRYESKDWTVAKRIELPLKTVGHDAPVALNPDGSKMILYLDDNGDGNLYESIRSGDSWSEPTAFKGEINSPYHESSAWYSPDGKQLYFVSDRPLIRNGIPKDRDIFVATWDEGSNEWGNIQRLPENINTEYDEDGIFVHPDGKTIYFSSKGHNSMGGYDVFKSVKQNNGSWSDPENLGYPINTPDDDIFFTVAANGRDAYITSYREGGFGDKDLYKITMLGDKKAPIVSGENILLANDKVTTSAINTDITVPRMELTVVKGIIRDEKTNLPLKSDIELVDNETNKTIAAFSSNSKTGRYLITLPSGKNYGVAVRADNYLFHSENFNLKGGSGYQEIDLDINLIKLMDTEAETVTKEQDLSSYNTEETKDSGSNKTQETGSGSTETKGSGSNKTQETGSGNTETKGSGSNKTQETGSGNTETKGSGSNKTQETGSGNTETKETDEVIGSIVLKNIFFDYDKYELRNESISELSRIVRFMNEYPKLRIKISGFTDSRGSDAYNKILSEKRAKAVVDYLVKNGIKRDRLVYQGYGKERPLVTDSEIEKMERETEKEAAYQKNRRTEFGILK